MSAPDGSKYPDLRARGLSLPDEEIDRVLEIFDRGIHEALSFFGVEMSQLPGGKLKVEVSDETTTPAYSPPHGHILFPYSFFTGLEEVRRSNAWSEIFLTLQVDPNLSLPIDETILSGGWEETVHMLQHRGLTPLLKETFTPEFEEWFKTASPLQLALCGIEVEARQAVDKIAVAQGWRPIWQRFDADLRARHPIAYGQSMPPPVRPRPVVSFN